MADKPTPGTPYFAGTIIREDGHIGRHIAVLFHCAHCESGIGRTRFSYLKAPAKRKYRTKSCGCEKRRCFDRFHRAAAARISPSGIRAIFTSYCTRYAKETAKALKINKYEANYAWQSWCRRLEALPEAHRHEVYSVCQVSWTIALVRFRHNASELMWLCRHWRQSHSLRASRARESAALLVERRTNALRIFAMYAPAGSITGSLYDDICRYLDIAISAANKPGFNARRYFGELTQKELARKRRSDFEWVFEMLKAMYTHQVVECFGQNGIDFLAVCHFTQERRRQRRINRIAHIEAGTMFRKASSCGGTSTRYTYLPMPEAHPKELALVIVTQHPYLLAA
jgi:hypothetical protein